MIRILPVVLAAVLVASLAAPAYSLPVSPAAISSGAAESRPLTSLPPTQLPAADTVDIFGYTVPRSAIRTDFGAIDLGGLAYNGNIGRSLVFGNGDLLPLAASARVVGLGKGADSFLGVAYSQNPLPPGTGFTYSPDPRLTFDSTISDILGNYTGPVDPGRFSGSSIIGADRAATDYGVTGNGTTVAIVDTGTDFSNEDMQHAIARDAKGIPVMLDADGQGIVLTKAKYIANIDSRTGRIMNYTGQLPENVTSSVYVSKSGVYLKTSQGTIPIYNSLYPLLGSPVLEGVANVDWKIGNSPDDYIRSKSGMYRFGAAYQISFQFGVITLVLMPVLLVDSEEPGVYDTIVPDMSYAWYTFTITIAGAYPQTNYLIPRDITFDFTDEKPFKLGDGNEHLVYDYNSDGSPDFSAGTAGARVLDIWRVTDNRTSIQLVDRQGYGGVSMARLLEPLDPAGDYFGLMYDFSGHGTSAAATVASKGRAQYGLYSNSTTYALAGMAPDAKILPVKALWAGDAVFGWLYASGFDQVEGKWKYTGEHKADIISNSWGISNFPLLRYGPGYDVLSVFSSLLVVPGLLAPDYPGTMMINSAGNNGLGYGSVGTPNVAPFNLAVGATSNNVHLQYSAFAGVTRFGSSAASYDEIAEFSSRGPGIFGDPKPELVAVGSYGFTPSAVTVKIFESKRDDPNNDGAFALFGGTSMAAPMTAGAAALVMSDLKERGKAADPFRVKNILMSSAKDLGNDPFVQGAGRVDALAAVQLARASGGKFLAYTDSTSKNIMAALAPAIKSYESTLGIIDPGYVQDAALEAAGENLPESRWFAGQIVQGQSASTQITVENPTGKKMEVQAASKIERLVARYEVKNTTRLFEVDPTHALKQHGFAPNYHNLTSIIGGEIPESDLMVARVNFPFSSFLNSTEAFGDHLRIASLYSYDWRDSDKDDKVAFGEINMVARGGSWGTTQELRVGDPASKFKGTPVLGVYPVPTIFSFWRGDRLVNSTSMDYTLTVEFYKRQPNLSIQFDGSGDQTVLTVPARGTAKLGATIFTGDDTMTGNYYGEILLTNPVSKHRVLMPVSYVVTTKPVPKDVPVVIVPEKGRGEQDLGLRPNGYVGGLSDMTSRYSAGDWRSYYFTVQDPTITSINLKVSWPHNSTSVNAMAFAPDGRTVASSVPSGVFQEFASWPSNDWLGTSPVSEGGFFYFSQNAGDNATVLSVPVNGTGTYSVLLHNTLFHGESLYEPLEVEAKFSTILPDDRPPAINADPPMFSTGRLKIPVQIDDQNPAGLSYSIDGADPVNVGTRSATQKAFVINANTTGLADGRHSIRIESADTVGHSSALLHEFIVDTTPPSSDITVRLQSGTETKVGDTMVVGGNATILWDVTDANGVKDAVLVTLPDSRPARHPASSSVQFDSTGFEDGEYEFVLRSDDLPGNRATRTVQLVVDNTPPDAKVSVNGGGQRGAIPVILSVSDAHVASAILEVGNTVANVTGLGEYTLDTTFLPDGKHEVKLTVTDAAGNVSVAASTLEVANVVPVIQATAAIGVAGGVAAGIAVAWFVLKRRR